MRNNKGSFLIFLGLLLIAAAFLLAGWNLREAQNAQDAVGVDAVAQLEAALPASAPSEPESLADATEPVTSTTPVSEVEIPDYILNPDMDMPVEVVNGLEYIGILDIPDLGLHLPVISSWDYSKLRTAPCRYEGSVYSHDLVVAAHNYDSHFGYLNSLDIGAEILFTDMKGNVFRYRVAAVETLMPTAVEEMCSGEYALSLFTCTVGGSYRVTVRCDMIEE